MLRNFTLAAAAAVLLFSAASCNKDSNNTPNSLPPAQQLVERPWTTDFKATDVNDNAELESNERQPVGLATYTFRSDNTGRIVGSIDGQQSSLEFTWQLLDNNNRLRMASSQSVDTGYILTLDDNSLLLKYGIEKVRWMSWKR